MKKIFSKEILIGLTVLITVVILFFGIEYLKGANLFHASNYYYATFTNVDGLAQSAAVTCNGFKVGQVKEIKYEYDNPGHVRVELSLDKELRVPRGTKAIMSTGLLGTATIVLDMPKGNTDYHNVGDDLIGVNPSGLMDNITSEMLPQVNNILPHVDSLIVAATYLISDPSLTNSVRRLDNVMANLETASAQLAVMMQTMPGIANSASTTMTNVNDFSRNLVQISNDLNQVAAQLSTLPIDSTYQNIHAITRNLNEISAQLNSPNSSAGLLLHDPGLYNNLNNSAAHLDSILIDIQCRPKRYIPSIKLF